MSAAFILFLCRAKDAGGTWAAPNDIGSYSEAITCSWNTFFHVLAALNGAVDRQGGLNLCGRARRA